MIYIETTDSSGGEVEVVRDREAGDEPVPGGGVGRWGSWEYGGRLCTKHSDRSMQGGLEVVKL